jgi:hypothetical protein
LYFSCFVVLSSSRGVASDSKWSAQKVAARMLVESISSAS